MIKGLLAIFRTEFIEYYRKYKVLIWLGLSFVLLRLPSLFEPYWYGDEGISLTVGMAINKGLLLYRDIYDNKTPFFYLISALANGRLYLFKLFSLFIGIGGVYFFHYLTKVIFFPKNTRALLISNVCFVILTATPVIEANIVNGEIIFLGFSLAGYFFGLTRNRYGVAGLFFSLAFLVKVPAIFDGFALALYSLARMSKANKTRRKEVADFAVAFTTPILASFLFFAIRGGLNAYFQSVFLQMIGYASSWQTNSSVSGLADLLTGPLLVKTVPFALLSFGVWRKWRTATPKRLAGFAGFWLICCLFGATISGRPYPHYLLQIAAPFSLCLGYLVLGNKNSRLIALMAVGLVVVTNTYYRYGTYPVFHYYQNFIKVIVGGHGQKDSYYRYFDPSLPEVYAVAGLIIGYTDKNDRIFVWSDYAQIYPLVKRLPTYRTTTAYHVTENLVNPGWFLPDTVKPPKVIVVDRRVKPYPELIPFIENRYRLAEESVNFDLFVNIR